MRSGRELAGERSSTGISRLFIGLATFAIVFSTTFAKANTNSGITYHGRVLKPDGRPLEGTTVQFKLQIRTPDASNCLMYEEVQTKDMRNSNGIFSITINDGTGTRTDLTGIPLDKIFANRGSFTFDDSTCAVGPGNYNPNPNDGRKFQVYFKDESMSHWEAIPQVNINFVPLAIESKQVGGFTANHLLRVEDAAVAQNLTPLTLQELTDLKALIAGTSSMYLKSDASGGASVPVFSGDPASPAQGSIWFDSVTGQLKYHDGTSVRTVGSGGGGGSGTVMSITAGDGLTGGTITTSGTIALEDYGTPGTYFKVTTDAKGRVTSGATSLVEADIPTLSTAGKVVGSAITSGTIGGSTAINTSGAITTTNSLTSGALSTRLIDLYDSTNTNYVRIQTPAGAGNYTLTLPATAGTSGQVLSTDGSGGLSWTTLSGSPTGTAGGDLEGSYPNPTLKEIVPGGGTGTKITYDSKGRVTGSSSLTTSDIPALDWSKITTGKPTTVDGYGITDAVKNLGAIVGMQAGNDADKPAAGTAGRLYMATDTQKVYYDNGANWIVVASVDAGGGGGSVTEVTVSGAPLSVINGTTTPQISISQAGPSSSGYLSQADWNTFNAKLDSSLNSGQIFVGNSSNVATARAPSGDVSMDESGVFTVAGLQGSTVSNTPPVDGQVLRYVGGGTNAWVPANFSVGDLKTAGGVQQFAQANCSANQTLTWSSLTDSFTCTNISITSSQVSDLGTMASEDAADYLTKAGNLSGLADLAAARTNLGFTATGNSLVTATDAAAARAALSAMENVAPGANGHILQSDGTKWVSGPLSLSASDIPNLDASKITSGQFDIARIPTGTTSATVAVGNDSRFPSSECGAGNKMRWDGNAWVCEPDNATDSTKVSKSGDTMTGALNLPSNGLSVGTDQLVATGGKVGIGVASPWSKLHVSGTNETTSLYVTNLNSTTSQYPLIEVRNYMGSAGSGSPSINVYNSRGSSTSPQALNAWDSIGEIGFLGQKSASSFGSGAAIRSYTSQNWQNNGTGAYLTFATTGDNETSPTDRLTITSSGNVGIGTTNPSAKLDVAGAIKVGNTSSTCNSSAEGQVRYNSTSKKMEYCDGTDWKEFGSGGGGGSALACAGGSNPQVYNGHCYTQFTVRTMSWTNARGICQAWGGDLVIINDANEQQFLINNYNVNYSWIGLTDDGSFGSSEGNPRWVDGTAPTYTNWNASNNQSSSRDHVRMNADGTWRYESGNTNYSFICEANVPYSSHVAQNMCPGEQLFEGEFIYGGDVKCDQTKTDYQCLNGYKVAVKVRSGGTCSTPP